MDLGSQTFRVAGVEMAGADAVLLFSNRNNVRMGQSLAVRGAFSGGAMKRGLIALEEFIRLLTQYRVSLSRAIATEAFRRASNARTFIEKAKEIGVRIEVVSPRQEAALAVSGAYLTVEEIAPQWIMVDSGGASTEVVSCHGQQALSFRSIDTGAVSLVEEYWRRGSGSVNGLIALARSKVEAGLEGFRSRIPMHGKVNMVATGGTATTIAAVAQGLECYDPRKVRGYEITHFRLHELYCKMVQMDIGERRRVKGLEPERADIFPAGIAILLEVIRYLGLRKIIISDGGILLGLLAASMEKECKFYAESSSARGIYL